MKVGQLFTMVSVGFILSATLLGYVWTSLRPFGRVRQIAYPRHCLSEGRDVCVRGGGGGSGGGGLRVILNSFAYRETLFFRIRRER